MVFLLDSASVGMKVFLRVVRMVCASVGYLVGDWAVYLGVSMAVE